MQCVMRRKQRLTIKVNHCIDTGGLVNFHQLKTPHRFSCTGSQGLFQHGLDFKGRVKAEVCEQAFMENLQLLVIFGIPEAHQLGVLS